MADESESLHDPNIFIFPTLLWFLAPLPRPADIVPGLANLIVDDGKGRTGTTVMAFTDLDLAERFVVATPREGVVLKPLTFEPADLKKVLLTLAALGETHLIFDPEPNHASLSSLRSLARIIAAIKA